MSQQSFIYRRKQANEGIQKVPESFCFIKEACQSCAYINDSYDNKLDLKFNQGVDLLRAAGVLTQTNIQPVQPSPRKYQYRSHAKLAVRPGLHEQRFAIGLFSPGSHDVVDLSQCPVHAEGINELIADLRTLLEASSLTAYDEKTQTGDLRYIAIRRAHHTGALMLTFVVTADQKRPLKDLNQQLRRLAHKISSVHMNINPSNGNAIFGDVTEVVFGPSKLRESVCDLSFEISPTAFFQVNPWMAETIYRRIEQLAGRASNKGGAHAWDLFCGGGQIAMILARLGYKTLGIEMNQAAVRDAEHNAMLNELVPSTEFIAGRTEDVQHTISPSFAEPELITVNPSRKGIPAHSIDFIAAALKKKPTTRLIYMSCDVETLARDLAILCEPKHGFHVRQIEAFDMFPFTDKLEWLAIVTN